MCHNILFFFSPFEINFLMFRRTEKVHENYGGWTLRILQGNYNARKDLLNN
jgi:hypothetical protein